jgi:uncharacterized membrane-anchored protein
MRVVTGAVAALLLSTAVAGAKSFEETFPDHPGYEEQEVNEILRSMDYQVGHVVLPGGQAELDVPDGYYYLDPEDATKVLSGLWGNPPDESLGMLFPARYTPWDGEAWGAELDFDPVGYVSDEDAEGYDYDALLKEMQADTREASRARIADGYDGVELVGWATPPSYDPVERKLHWALELQFTDSDWRTLNYKLRALGREGVLSANFIGTMEQLAEIQAGLPDVARMIHFSEGKTYADFDPSVDQVAAFGVAGLIAGKVLTSKTGLIALAAILLKKFGVVLLLPFAWVANKFRRS